jgi:murein DD-endopeptidase MepM/ murein hydrolase activator NlpD
MPKNEKSEPEELRAWYSRAQPKRIRPYGRFCREGANVKLTRKVINLVSIILIAAGSTALGQQISAPGIKNVFWQPNDLQQGSPALFTVELTRVPARLSGKWIDKDLMFFKSSNPKIWYALAGADLDTQPGTYDLALTATMPGHKIAHATKQVNIAAASFQSSAVEVPENFVEPDQASKKRIAEDQRFKNRAFAHLISKPQWSGNFISPVNAKATPSFGMNRIFNEELTSTHRGTDFPISGGSPVIVSNSGSVVLTRELFYEGNCVIVDHGQRLYTVYMHLSKIDVKDGEKLTKGERIGLSGDTGRATGPHLHLGVRWNGAYLDPVQLLGLTLPQLRAKSSVHRRARPHRH